MPTICPSCGTRNLEGADTCSHCGAALTHMDLPVTDAAGPDAKFLRQPLSALGLAQPVTIAPDRPLEEAVRIIADKKLDLINVVENGRLIGVLSVRDILSRAGVNYLAHLGQPVSALMTPSPVTLPPDAPIPFALNKMDIGGYRHVPIVEDDRLLGLVSAHDVLRELTGKAK